jgi:hypothetical protein
MAGLKLVAELGGDGSGFDTMMRRAAASTDRFGQAFSGLKSTIAGAFTIGAVTSFARKILETADHISDTAQQLQITTDEVQKLEVAADRAGLSLEKIGGALARLGTARRAAAEKDDEMLKTFERFGVTMTDLQNPNLRNLDLLNKMAEASKGLALSNRDLADLGDIFGQRMQGVFAVMEEMADLGPIRIIDETAIADLKRANTVLKDMNRDITSFSTKLIAGQITNMKIGFEMWKRVLGVSTAEEMVDAIDEAILGPKISREEVMAAAKRGPQPQDPLFEDKRKLDKIDKTDRVITDRALHQAATLPTDALVAVGNFLGRNPALVNSIANQQLQVTQQQLDVLKQIAATLSASPSARSGLTLQVPL